MLRFLSKESCTSYRSLMVAESLSNFAVLTVHRVVVVWHIAPVTETHGVG